MADRMIFFRTELTGGGANALDNVDGDDRCDGNPLQEGDAAVVLYDGKYYLYLLDDDIAGVEDSPWKIRPDTNAGDKRWICNTLNPFILSGTSATAPSAAGLPDGTIYFKYVE